jgi:hypothetical protein
VPTVAKAVQAAYPLTGRGPVDGVILIDPIGLAALLKVTGPITVAPWPEPLTPDNTAQILNFDHYDRLKPPARDDFQGAVVRAVIDRLTVGDLAAPSELAAALAPAVRGGHLQLWSPDRAAEALFRKVNAAGELRPPKGADFIELVTQNGSAAKIDWFLRRSLRYEAVVDPDTGDVRATAVVTLTNSAPTEGLDPYVIGGTALNNTRAGESRLFLTLYSALDLDGVTDEAGQPLGVNLGQENGLTAMRVLLRIPPGGSRTIRFQLTGGADLSGGDYQLILGHQATAWPDQVDLKITGGPSLEQSMALVERLSFRLPSRR